MPLAQRHRTQLHDKLAPIVGEDTIEALLAEFPATDLDKPASQAFVRAEIAELRTELKGEIAELRTELAGDITDLRTEVGGVRNDLLRLDASFSERLRQQTMWMTGILITGITAAAAVGRVVG